MNSSSSSLISIEKLSKIHDRPTVNKTKASLMAFESGEGRGYKQSPWGDWVKHTSVFYLRVTFNETNYYIQRHEDSFR